MTFFTPMIAQGDTAIETSSIFKRLDRGSHRRWTQGRESQLKSSSDAHYEIVHKHELVASNSLTRVRDGSRRNPPHRERIVSRFRW
jgi:hypothetical protein